VATTNRVRAPRILREAEGYLELNMPRTALEVLARLEDAGTFRARHLKLQGEALRSLERYADALVPLSAASQLAPSDIEIWLSLGWCHKRTGHIDQAIESLERAQEVEPSQPLIQYNLACYWSLAGQKQRALEYLSRAITMKPKLRELVNEESDFDPIRDDPGFQALVSVIV
jgi:Flp pilus assembly protein TadD